MSGAVAARSALARGAVAAAVVAVLVAPWLLGGFAVSLTNDIGIATLVALGLVLLTGVGGATSFGQAAFVGIAAYGSAWLTTAQGASPWLGLLFAIVLAAVAALAIGLLTLRLGGHFLPLSTIAWGLSIALVFGNVEALGRHSGLANVPPLTLAGVSLAEPAAMHYLIWALVGVAFLLARNLLDSRPGRAMRGLRGGATLLASVGADAFRVRLTLFVVAALLAGVAGWLYAHANRFVSPAPFDLRASIEYLLMAVAGGLGHLVGAVLGAAIVLGLKSQLQDVLPLITQRGSSYEAVAFALLFVLLLQHARAGVAGLVARAWRARADAADPTEPAGRSPGDAHASARDGAATAAPTASAASAASAAPAASTTPADTPAAAALPRRMPPARGVPLLRVDAAVKRFGGLVAVDGVGFEVRAGEILGLIGPNGAGKSTMFNLVTGVLPLTAGRVEFLGQDVTGWSQRRRARAGMARTFQHVKLRPHMTLLDNVALGAHARARSGVLAAALGLDAREERAIRAEAMRCLARIGLADRAHRLAGSLPLGTQRLLEIARALAADPVLLVLDEPAAGLRRPEKQALAALLRGLRDDGVTILVVEHDMDFVMRLVDRLVVMNFGSKLAEGEPAAVRADPQVQAAYLGGAPAAADASGTTAHASAQPPAAGGIAR